MMKTFHTPCRYPSIHPRPRRAAGVFALPLTVVVAWAAGGCQKQQEIPPMTVTTVTAYGQTLDADATPQQVAFVLMRSLRDDVEAAQAHDRKAQREAFRTTFALAACSMIDERLAETYARPVADSDASEPIVMKERVYEIVNHWAPIVAYYVGSFPRDFEQAADRMRVVKIGPDDGTAMVLYPVQHDPDQAAHGEPVLLEIELVKESATDGPQRFWRVARVAFRGPMPTVVGPTESPVPATNAP